MVDIRTDLDGLTLPATEGMRKHWHITEPLGHVGLVCILYFRNGHLPEIQTAACECLREYARIVGTEIRSYTDENDRFVSVKKKGLVLLDEKKVRDLQKGGKLAAYYGLYSSVTRKECALIPHRFMLDLWLLLQTPTNPYFSLDTQISYFYVSFAPSLFLLDEPPISFADLVLRWCERLRPVSGHAGWGITRPVDRVQSHLVRRFITPYLRRFPGLTMPDTCFPLFQEHIADINWLTMINEELAARIGGPQRLRALGEDFPVAEYPGGYVVQAGPRPEIGDRDNGDLPRFYGKVQDLLRPLYPTLPGSGYPTDFALPPNAPADYAPTRWGGPVMEEERDRFLHQWLHRFE